MVQFLGYIIGEEGIQIDQGKVTAVTEWSTHQFVKELQRFLGFANFYRSFIKGFSLLTALLTTLLRGKPKSLSWSSSTHEAFKSLRTAFSKAHLSVHLPNGNPFWAQFTMHRALDIQAANGTSRSSMFGTGGPVCPVTSSGTSAVAQSVSCPRLLAICRWASSYLSPFLVDPGHTWEFIL